MSRGRDTLIPADENRRMFDAIAGRYDLMNRLISLGFDHGWRRRAVELLGPVGGARYLDVGTGTGDLAIEILHQQPDAEVVGVDPAGEMLAIAREKTGAANLASAVSFHEGDATALPFEEGAFAGAVTGFCIRNVEDRLQALSEMLRVLRPGGRLIVLELSVPTGATMATLHRVFGRTVLPATARLLSRRQAYRYLVDSVDALPPPEQILTMLDEAGFEETEAIPLTWGVVSIFSGVRPRRDPAAAP